MLYLMNYRIKGSGGVPVQPYQLILNHQSIIVTGVSCAQNNAVSNKSLSFFSVSHVTCREWRWEGRWQGADVWLPTDVHCHGVEPRPTERRRRRRCSPQTFKRGTVIPAMRSCASDMIACSVRRRSCGSCELADSQSGVRLVCVSQALVSQCVVPAASPPPRFRITSQNRFPPNPNLSHGWRQKRMCTCWLVIKLQKTNKIVYQLL